MADVVYGSPEYWAAQNKPYVAPIAQRAQTPMQKVITGAYNQAGYTKQSSPPNTGARWTPPKASAPSRQASPAKSNSNYSGGGNSNYSGGSSYSAPKRSYSSSSSGGGGGGSVSSFSAPAPSAPAPPPPPVMQDITIPDAGADTTYQKTVADLARAAVDFKAQQGLARGQYDTQYNDAERRMGWSQGEGKFDAANPGAYHDSVDANQNDFAGRGMYYSGAMGNAFGDINRDFGDRKTSLDTARNDNVNTQNQALSSFSGQQDATKSAAMTDAVSKIAAQYGIDLSQVPQGTGPKVIQKQVG